MATSEVDEVLELLAIADSPALTAAARLKVRSLAAAAHDSPAWVLERLIEIARAETERLQTTEPDSCLYRAVALDTFHRHCVAPEWRPELVGPEEFRRAVESHSMPEEFLRSVLSADVVFPASHSWLIQSDTVLPMSGAELVHALQLDKQAPPFVLCVMPVDRMIASGVRVRRPSPADAVLGRHTIWSPDGVPAGQEYVDLDIPGTAISETKWRP